MSTIKLFETKKVRSVWDAKDCSQLKMQSNSNVYHGR